MMRILNRNRNLYLLLAFAGYLIYLWWAVNPSLYLIKNYREFFTGSQFFIQYFEFPGNPVDYFSRFITQFYIFPFFSSLIITTILALIYALGLLVFNTEKINYWLPLIPVVALMAMHNDYGHSIKFDLNILFLMLALLFYFFLYKKKKNLALIIFPFLLAAILFLCGNFTAILFLAIALLSVFKPHQNKSRILILIAETFIIVFLFRLFFNFSINDLKQELTDTMRVYSFPFFPYVLYSSVLIAYILSNLTFSIKIKFLEKFQKPVITIPSSLILWAAIMAMTFHFEQRQSMLVQHYALEQNWEKVLTYSKKCSQHDKNVAYYTNEALYKTGKIFDDLFLYNQGFGAKGMMSAEINGSSEILPNQDIFMQLGALSLSVVWGTEATNVYGANPYILKRMTKAYLAEGCYKEAQKMLNLLSQSLFNSEWVTRYQKFVDDTTLVLKDSELRAFKMNQMPKAIVYSQNDEMNLYHIANNTPSNKMAYDYLLISTMLDNRMGDFASFLPAMKSHGYHEIPKLYFEGLLYNSLYAAQSPINIKEYTFNKSIIDRFEAFGRDLSAMKNNPKDARKKLQKKYGDTYWYYILFQSPIPDDERREALSRMMF